MPNRLSRRDALKAGGLVLASWLPAVAAGPDAPTDDPTAALKLPWTGELKWAAVVDVTRFPGATADEKLANAQAAVVMKGGGVVYFPAGEYRFA